MVATLHVLSIILVAVGMGLALAHALELPGKRRLDEATFRAVQTIYYPGFTIGGVFGEPLAFLATAGLLALTPAERTPTTGALAAALLFMLLAHAVYWTITHPVNKVWLGKEKLGRPARPSSESARRVR
ncbi:MAG: hypothetical protein KIT25_17420 [Enhydrobacter sp.]|nr:MAG: hypothetical protein KIT25_17420 [Enhydrobacter sp.]